jgi:hypothetical protein
MAFFRYKLLFTPTSDKPAALFAKLESQCQRALLDEEQDFLLFVHRERELLDTQTQMQHSLQKLHRQLANQERFGPSGTLVPSPSRKATR